MTEFTNVKDFPLIYNETQRATLGVPRSFQIVDEETALFLNNVDDKGTLGIYIAKFGTDSSEELLVNPSTLLDSTNEIDIPDEVKALKERLRDLSTGISSFQYSKESDILMFSLSTSVFLFSIDQKRILRTFENIFLPRLSPDGQYLCACQGRALEVYRTKDGELIKTIERDNYIWGQPDFISAEEMGRYSSTWFSPDSKTLVSLGYNDNDVELTFIKNNADAEAKAYKYPYAGTANPKLFLNTYQIENDDSFVEINDEYYVDTVFCSNKIISITLNREQNKLSSSTGDFTYESYRAIDLLNVVPTCLGNNKWLHYDIDRELDTRHLALDGKKIKGTDSLINVFGFSKNHLFFQIMEDGQLFTIKRISIHDLESEKCLENDCTDLKITSSTSPAHVYINNKTDAYILIERNELSIFPNNQFKSIDGSSSTFSTNSDFNINFDVTRTLKNYDNQVRALITKPNKSTAKKLPLIVYSYGGPSSFTVGHIHRYAIGSKHRSLTQSWLASLGFIVVSIDGAGTPIGTISREDATAQDFYEPTIKDQVDVVNELIKSGEIDEDRIAIMGWSFGGYLSGACISKYPNIFKAAVIGAPVSDWILYDTCYTERFIGNPNIKPDNYERSSLLNKTFSKDSMIRLIHGRSDDNVLYANSEKLRDHLVMQGLTIDFVTIDDATHMVGNANDAAKLLIDDVMFLSEALNMPELKDKLVDN